MLDVKVYRDSNLWIGALPVNERNFRGEKDKDVYGLLPAMGISDENKKGKKADDYFRVRPGDVALPIILPTTNRQNMPDQAWLNVGQSESGGWSELAKANLHFEVLKRQGQAVDHGMQEWREKRKRNLEPSVLTRERGSEFLLWGNQSLDFSAHTERPTADFIERIGDGLMDGGDHETYLLRSHYAPFAAGSLVPVSGHEFFQKPALIAVVTKKRKSTVKERLLGRGNTLPEQLLAPNTIILDRYRYLEECRQHRIVQRHIAALDEYFDGSIQLELFTNRDYPAIVKKLGSDFHFAYNLRVVGEVRKIPEVNGQKLVGFFNPTKLGELLEAHKAEQRSAAWLTKGLEKQVFNGPTAWLDRAPAKRDPSESRPSVVKVA